MTFKVYKLECPKCGERAERLMWNTDPVPVCPVCLVPYVQDSPVIGKSAAVIGDECDVTVPHGICNPDGTPKRYTSKSDMRQAARALGLTNAVEHVPMPGTDKSPLTTRWV